MTILSQQASKSRRVRAKLGHPVIDADGHSVEFGPPLEDYVRAIGGSQYGVRCVPRAQSRHQMESDAERLQKRITTMAWWVPPTANTLDRATSQLPRLMYERMDDMGLDYAVLFPTTGPVIQVYRKESGGTNWQAGDPELRRVATRAVNAYRKDLFWEFRDRLTPAMGVSMQTPEEAIADLEHAVNELHAKVISIGPIWRPVPGLYEEFSSIRKYNSQLFDRRGMYLDVLGIDSPYDWDPFWKRCLELRVAVADHGVALGYTGRASPSNHCFNHIGAFADAGEAVCKALFFGGVTRRFPDLKVAFLEGGAGNAVRTYCDLFGHWDKRGAKGIQNMDPARLDQQLFVELHKQYGGSWLNGHLDKVLSHSNNVMPEDLTGLELDDFARCHIQTREDIRDLFVPHFFFGCEADDPINAMAFNNKLLPYGVNLNAIFSSDMGHWDVPDLTEIVEEAYELVEDGLLTPEQLRAFTFSNAVNFFAGSNPDFFKGTRVEEAVAREKQTLGI